MKHCIPAAFALCILSLSGCAPALETTDGDPQDAFFARLSALCGNAYPGQLITDDAADANLAGKPMVMHVASCSDDEIRIPFHIEMKPGEWNRSRTWIVTRTAGGLRLKHRHRHKDGSADAITMYGGDTATTGTAARQEFPVDPYSIAMFREGGLAASVTNVWAIEVDDLRTPDAAYTYELSRKNRLFRVRFDLSDPIAAPPLPWGWNAP